MSQSCFTDQVQRSQLTDRLRGACLSAGAGVFVRFVLLGSTFDNDKLWLVGILIAIVMLGITYGAKYANAQSRREFTPVDLIQYTSQGFLWPSAWPSLAAALGVSPIAPPANTGSLLDALILSGFA